MTRREAWVYYARKIGGRTRAAGHPGETRTKKSFMGAVMSYRELAFRM